MEALIYITWKLKEHNKNLQRNLNFIFQTTHLATSVIFFPHHHPIYKELKEVRINKTRKWGRNLIKWGSERRKFNNEQLKGLNEIAWCDVVERQQKSIKLKRQSQKLKHQKVKERNLAPSRMCTLREYEKENWKPTEREYGHKERLIFK